MTKELLTQHIAEYHLARDQHVAAANAAAGAIQACERLLLLEEPIKPATTPS